MGFLESVFSYVFGDSDPNEELSGVRLRKFAEYVRGRGGVVSGEEIAVFLDDVPDFEERRRSGAQFVDESYVLPVTTRLGGVPEVTENGDIVYVFDELMESGGTGMSDNLLLASVNLPPDASDSDVREALGDRGVSEGGLQTIKRDGLLQQISTLATGSDDPLTTRSLDSLLVEFSSAPPGNLLGAGALGVVNLAGGIYLKTMLSSPALAGVTFGGYAGIVQAFLPGT